MDSVFFLTVIITVLGSFVLALVVVLKRPYSRLHGTFAGLACAMGLWSLGVLMMRSSHSIDQALFWVRLSGLGLVFIPSTFFHFVQQFQESNNSWRSQSALIVIFYALSSAFAPIVFTSYFYKTATYVHSGFYTTPGMASRVFDALFIVVMLMGVQRLIRGFRIAKGSKRNQFRWMLLAAVIAIASGFINILPLYGIWFAYPLGHLGIATAILLFGYAILKHRLMEIDIVIRKSALYSILTAMVTAGYVASIFIVQKLFQNLTGYKSLVPVILMALVVALTFEPARRYIQLYLDKLFFKKQYRYQQILREASETLRTITDPKQIANYLIHTVDEVAQIMSGWMMLYDKALCCYTVTELYGAANGKYLDSLTLEKEDYLVKHLQGTGRELWFEDAQSRVLRRDTDKTEIKKLEKLGTHLIFPLISKDSLIGVLFLGAKKSEDEYTMDEIEFIFTLCNQAAMSFENSRLYGDLQLNYLNTIRSLVAALEAKDQYTKGHSERVAEYTKEIALEFGFSKSEAQLLYEVSLLHDVGKIGISEQILNKPSRLTPKEFAQIKTHPVIGEKILSAVESLEGGLSAVRHHHEQLNGGGYPDGLSVVDIPLQARILAVADSYDAMVTKRPYRPAMSSEEAIAELKRHSCEQFDPRVVRALISIIVSRKSQDPRRKSTRAFSQTRKRGILRSA